MFQMRFTIIAFGVSAVLFSVSTADAQVTVGNVSAGHSEAYSGGSGGTYTYLDLTAYDISGLGVYVGVQLNGDWDYRLDRASGTGHVNAIAYLPFSIGNLPVQVSNLAVGYDFKVVNGGGNSTTPNTSETPSALIFERLAPADTSGPQAVTLFSAPAFTQNGNGFSSENGVAFNSSPSTYVLAANTNYTLEVYSNTFFDNSSFISAVPTVTIGNEFGGDLLDSYYLGFNATFDWVTVPEPSTFALGALGLLGVSFAALRQKHRRALQAAVR